MATPVPPHLIPPHEAERLEELAAYQILYTQAEEAFDNLTRIMAQVFETPMVFMSLVDAHTVFYKSQVGPFGRTQVSRNQSLCSLSILKTEPTVFEDTWQESALTTNPLTRGEGGIRFYAGAPLITAHGLPIGSICVVDTSPRVFPQARRELLQQFARVFIHEMDLRLTALNLARAQAATAASEARLSTVIAHVPASMVLYRGPAHVVDMPNQNFITLIDRGPDVSGKPLGELMPELEGQAYLGILDEVYTTGQPYRSFGAPVAIRQRDGAMQHRFMDLNYAPLLDSAGQVDAILSVATDVTDVVVARRERDESQRQLLALFEQSPVALATYSVDDAFVIQWANPFFGELVARPPQAIMGKPLLEALPELKGQGFEEILKKVITTNTPFIANEVAVSILRNGQLTTIYVDLTYQPQRGALDKVEAILVVAVDVTQQVLARQKIEEAEGRLRAIIRHLPSATVVLRGRELMVETPSQHFINILDRGPDVTGKPLRELMPELENQSFLKILDTVYTSGQTFRAYGTPVAIQQGDGSTTRDFFDLIYTPLLDTQGKPYAILSVATNVTDVIMAHQQLQESEERYRLLSVHLEEQVQQRTEELAATNEELVATNEELSANNQAYAAINEDLQEANFLLNRSNDNLQQFAYVASHDLQEPLRKIQQFGDLLKIRYAGASGEELGYLERIQVAARRMSMLIKDLLDFSRLTTRSATSAPVVLNQVIDDVLIDLELVLTETGARVEVDPLPVVAGDAGQLGQLFQNLLSNALKFRRPEVAPHIQIKSNRIVADQLPAGIKLSRDALAYYQIEVIDNGIGFDEKYVDRIFEVFQRLHGRKEYGGTGIGLAICEKVISQHGGAITARSQPGQGATFSVYLPG